jgi:hypothetical protein
LRAQLKQTVSCQAKVSLQLTQTGRGTGSTVLRALVGYKWIVGGQDFCPWLCLFGGFFLGWWFRDLLRFFVKNVVQIVVFGVVKMDMLW